MTSTLKRRSMAVIMTLLMCFSMFVSFGTTAQAAGERSEIYMVSYPRGTDTNREHWERDDLQFMNGWHMDAYDMFAAFCVGSYEGKIAYCIEPGVHIENGDPFTSKDETFWDNYPSAYNKTIDAVRLHRHGRPRLGITKRCGRRQTGPCLCYAAFDLGNHRG